MKLHAILALLLAAMLFFTNHAVRAEGLKVGEPAPEFSLPDQNGTVRTLSEFRGKWLVLYFYVKDDTPGCTEQACRFRDDIQQLSELGAEVVGGERGQYRQSRRLRKKIQPSVPSSVRQQGRDSRALWLPTRRWRHG